MSLLTAADFWRTRAIPEKNIPAIKATDGPNGARGGIFVGGTKVSTFFGNEASSPTLLAPTNTTTTGRSLPLWCLPGSNMEQGPAPRGGPPSRQRNQGKIGQHASCTHHMHAPASPWGPELRVVLGGPPSHRKVSGSIRPRIAGEGRRGNCQALVPLHQFKPIFVS